MKDGYRPNIKHKVKMTKDTSGPLKVVLKNDTLHLNLPDYLPDEISYSYILRFARVNAVSSITDMMKLLENGSLNIRKREVRIDTYNSRMADTFILSNGEVLFERASTITPLKFLVRDRILPDFNMIGRIGRFCFLEPLRICPECMKEDVSKYGTAYYHRIHHIPSVSICPYHGCGLIEYGDAGEDFSFRPDTGTECRILPYAEEYAEFVKRLLMNPERIEPIRSADTISIIKEHLDFAKAEKQALPTNEEMNLYSHGAYHTIQRIMMSTNVINPGAALFTIYRLFGTYEQFISAVDEYVARQDFRENAEKNCPTSKVYKLLSVESRNGFRYVKLEHAKCGGIFWRGLSELETRAIECPICRKLPTTPAGFRAMFEEEFGKDFILLNEYTYGKGALEVRIKGTDITIRDTPGKMVNRLRWLMEDEMQMNRLKTTGVVRDLVSSKGLTAKYIRTHFHEDEPFLSSSLPSNPDMNIILKDLCDKGDIHRIATGLYSRKPIIMTTEQIIDFRYIRNGAEIYGYNVGDRFLEEVIPGYKGNTSVRHIVTNSDRNVLYHKDRVVIRDITCNIYRSETPVDKSNYRVLSLIGFFRHEDACSFPVTQNTIHGIAVWALDNGIGIEDIFLYVTLCTERTKERISSLVDEMERICQERR